VGRGTVFYVSDDDLPTGVDAEPPTRTRLSRGPDRTTLRLVAVAGPSKGVETRFDGGPLRIGKSAANQLCVEDPTVSRFHCVIEQTPRGLVLRDLGSTNGTQVGGCFIDRIYISAGIEIKIGGTTLQLVGADTPARASEPTADPRFLGSSPPIQRLLASLPRVAHSGVTVLIEGETGTGKSVLAELVHQLGPRAPGPFMVLDCGSIPASLIESELFGHERGAFTGATERRIGAFEAAQGGTIFLDEIGELPIGMQPKLLRALEERVIKRVGSTKVINIDVRVIAATNRELRAAVSRGTFRADLYYRLEALRLYLPPLRERREDIPALIEQFARKVQPAVPEDVLDGLKRNLAAREEWPGNVRELRNAVEKALLLGDLGSDETSAFTVPVPLQVAHQGGRFDASLPFRVAKEEAIAAWERGYLLSLMEHASGILSRAARDAQMDRSHLRDLLRRYQIIAPGMVDRPE
jgi:transcriptional regulator with GAF, ATPase, and Fis domain